jgi:putative ABC transport system permease protein
VQVLEGLKAGDEVVVYSEKELAPAAASRWSSRWRGAAMISLAGRDILHSWGKFVLTGIGLGLLIGVTLTMAGVYRGMVDDAHVLLDNSGADLWVVQKDTQGPYAESVQPARRRGARRARHARRGARRQRHLPDDAGAQRRVPRATARRARHGGRLRARASRASPGYLVAGRHITRSHYEAVADVRTGLSLGERIRIRRHDYTVVGLTRRMVSSGGDPMVFIPLKDAQEAQFLKDNDAIVNERARTAANPASTARASRGCWKRSRPRRPATATSTRCWCSLQPGPTRSGGRADPALEAPDGLHRAQMEEILVGKLIATSARQIGMFLVILAIVSAAIVAFIIYTMTLGKIREIAVLKLIGTRNRTIAGTSRNTCCWSRATQCAAWWPWW